MNPTIIHLGADTDIEAIRRLLVNHPEVSVVDSSRVLAIGDHPPSVMKFSRFAIRFSL